MCVFNTYLSEKIKSSGVYGPRLHIHSLLPASDLQ